MGTASWSDAGRGGDRPLPGAPHRDASDHNPYRGVVRQSGFGVEVATFEAGTPPAGHSMRSSPGGPGTPAGLALGGPSGGSGQGGAGAAPRRATHRPYTRDEWLDQVPTFGGHT
jgi:hypothetical protein